jgi:hypothetical protein
MGVCGRVPSCREGDLRLSSKALAACASLARHGLFDVIMTVVGWKCVDRVAFQLCEPVSDGPRVIDV